MALSQYDISVENAGTFGMTFDLGGYTPDFIKSMQDMQKQMAAARPAPTIRRKGMAMLGLMQQLTFNSRVDPLGRRFADRQGARLRREQQGQKPDDIANQAKAMVPFLLAQLNNPELDRAGDRGRDQISRRAEEHRDLGRARRRRFRSR